MRSILMICTLLIAMTVAVYWQVGSHEFINYDDNDYITDNPHMTTGITVPNVVWAFTSLEPCNWHPITWLSHLADAQLYGMNPRGHFLTNVLIHTVATFLLFLLLLRITASPWQSFFVAALFALHPLHVESVAWVAERKDLLSAFFWFLTLYLYSLYVEHRNLRLYLVTLISFGLGLMSKPMLVTLPLVLLLLDFWPLQRGISRHITAIEPDAKPVMPHDSRGLLNWLIPLIKEKTPFFVLSLASSVITIYAQQKGGAINSLNAVPLGLRIANASQSYVKYIIKTFCPQNLAIIYPFPASIPFWQVIGALLILLFVSCATIRFARRHPYLAVGWLWFLVTLLPVIGLIQVGEQSMADRYTYLPIIGLFIMVAWGVSELVKEMRYRYVILAVLTSTVLVASASLTWHQLGFWRDGESVFRHAVNVTTGNCIAHYNLGAALFDKGELGAAVSEFQTALVISPGDPQAHNNMGIALDKTGDLDGAIREFQLAISINPGNFEGHYNLGIALFKKNDLNGAIKEFQQALTITPHSSAAQSYLDSALMSQQQR